MSISVLNRLFANWDRPNPSFIGTYNETTLDGIADDPVEESNLQEFQVSLEGQSIGVEYINSKGQESRRILTLRQIKSMPDGRRLIIAFCNTRKSIRTFRLDRIQSVFDFDGQVFEPEAFFEELLTGYDIEMPTTSKAIDIFLLAMDAIHILTALARIDGEFHKSEMAQILEFVQTLAEEANLAFSPGDRQMIARRIYRHYPERETVFRALSELQTRDRQFLDRTLTYCGKVIDADGQHSPEEIELIMEIKDHVTA